MSVRSLNKVQLIGNLTRDPELRYTPSGTAVCTFGLATNRSWTTQSGETKEETEFHRIVSWNKLAELCSQLLSKGRKVYIEGRLQTRSWESPDGEKRQATEVVAEDMVILDARKQPEGESEGASTDRKPETEKGKDESNSKSKEEKKEKDSDKKEDEETKGEKEPESEDKKEKSEKKEEKNPPAGGDDEIDIDDIPF